MQIYYLMYNILSPFWCIIYLLQSQWWSLRSLPLCTWVECRPWISQRWTTEGSLCWWTPALNIPAPSMRGWNACACRWRTVLTPLWTSTLTAWLSGSSRTTLEARWCSARPVEAGLRLSSWRISWGLRESHCFRLISGLWLPGPSSARTRGSGGNCFSMRGNWPTATASGWWPPHRASYLRPSSSHRTRHTAFIYNSGGRIELDLFIWCVCV